MKSFFQKHLLPCFLLFFLLLGGLITLQCKKGLFLSEDKKFEQFLEQLFLEEVSANTLNLHYTLANPAQYGIQDYPLVLGHISSQGMIQNYAIVENAQAALHHYTYSKLSSAHKMTYEILDWDLKTQLSLGENYMLTELLSPNLGVQTQLPILLAEYTFRSKQDVLDYLALLSSIPNYFKEILDFEQEKAQQGLFMSDTSVSRIIEQCHAFLASSDNSYLSALFKEKLASASDWSFSAAEAASYLTTHQTILEEQVFPAYSSLMEGLEKLKGSGKNPNGLYYYPNGVDYYTYLLQSNVGLAATTLSQVEERLYQQLICDYKEMQNLLRAHPDLPSLIETLASGTSSPANDRLILSDLQKKMLADFPPMDAPSYEVKYVHPSLQEFLSPAFYLTPPIDTLSPNIIYINPNTSSNEIERFTTLAHEGFPGHLYQTLYFNQTKPSNIRYLLENNGYIEGWATYVESYAYQYADADSSLTRLLWLNRSLNLCLYSIMDIGIHGHGWTLDTVQKHFASFGIHNPEATKEIFQYIVENPANYLQYYVGYLNFYDLKQEMQDKIGNDFILQEFHQKILTLGPAPFSILKKYLFASY